MTDERDDLLKIFDSIMNNDCLWDVVSFKRHGQEVTINGIDKTGNKFTWKEEVT